MQFSEAVRTRTLPARLEKFAPAPAFKFTAQDGSAVANEDLKGKIWVANFIFTRCKGPCPVMTSRMAQLNQSLAGRSGQGVGLVSFTVDPEYDTPAILKEYGETVGADPAKWKFLTGPKEQVDDTVMKGFLQALSQDQEGMPIHSTRFVLVDRDGWMRGFHDGNDPEVVQKLLMDIGALMGESSARKP